MSTKPHSNLIETKIVDALTDDWQSASTVCAAIYGTSGDYDDQIRRGALYYHLRNLSDTNIIERDNRMVGGRRVNFYRRLQ